MAKESVKHKKTLVLSWERGTYQIACGVAGAKTAAEERMGYVSSVFGICREDSKWLVTHLPTGYGCPGQFKTLRAAKVFCSTLILCGQFLFTNPDGAAAKRQLKAAREVFSR